MMRSLKSFLNFTVKISWLTIYYLIRIRIYLINFLKFNGFELNFTTCANCGIKLTNNCHLSLTVGGFVCEVCNDNYDVVLEKNVFSSLKIISNTDIEKLSTVKLNNNIIIKCLLVLKLIFNNNFKVKLNSINIH